MAHILVVAADTDLGRSLEFALRAEGHEVTRRSGIEGVDPAGRFDCTVLDHHAAGADFAASVAFCVAHQPVILLANVRPDALSPWAFTTLQKPLLGPALVSAIRDAEHSRAIPTQTP